MKKKIKSLNCSIYQVVLQREVENGNWYPEYNTVRFRYRGNPPEYLIDLLLIHTCNAMPEKHN